MSYISVSGEHVTEKVIERSRFITTSAHAEGEEEARAFVARVSAKYKDATHNCYAYIADAVGNFPRFSDDGEPSGTAGMPMLEVIKNKKLFCTAVVVTRYFGGIKLQLYAAEIARAGSCAPIRAALQKILTARQNFCICLAKRVPIPSATKVPTCAAATFRRTTARLSTPIIPPR